MRALSRTSGLLVVAVLGGVLAGCASDIEQKVMCSSNSDCFNTMNGGKAGTLYNDTDVDAAAAEGLLPQCCAGFCLVPAGGCDSGFRYMTFDPNNQPSGGYGECVMTPMCSALDMAMSSQTD